MSKNRTEKSRFLSNYGNPGEELFCTSANYLSEIMCARQAARDGKKLGPRFWKNKEWAKAFVLQAKFANELLKEYHVKVILKALGHRKAINVYSLGLKSVIKPLCDEFDKEIISSLMFPVRVEVDEIDVNEKPRPAYGGDGLLAKLKGL